MILGTLGSAQDVFAPHIITHDPPGGWQKAVADLEQQIDVLADSIPSAEDLLDDVIDAILNTPNALTDSLDSLRADLEHHHILFYRICTGTSYLIPNALPFTPNKKAIPLLI